MAKPKVFIGASLENDEIAAALQQALDYDGDVEIWHQGTFQASEYPLESLERMLEQADFAIFVFSPDDVTIMRGQERNTVRDNVVFELGLFIGRLTRKRTFIVTPRDVKLDFPSDLYALTPLTYANGRDNLRAALGPASTEIKTAMREYGPISRPSRELAIQDSAPTTDQSGVDTWDPPNDEWELEDFERRYFIAVFTDREAEAKQIDEAFRRNGLAQTDEAVAVWESRCGLVHLRKGEHRSIQEFRDRVAKYPKNLRLRSILASVLIHYGSKEEALREFERVAEESNEPSEVGWAISQAIEVAVPPPETAAKYRDLLMKGSHTSRDALQALKKIAASSGLIQVARALDELRLKREPDNTMLRFELAYQYAEDGHDNLAYFHYRAVPYGQRSGTLWNNLGVALGNLGMSGLAVDAYRAAADKGETIADANLAQKLRQAGFFDEARQRAQEAVKVSDHHQNVVAALSDIENARREEKAREEEVIKGAEEAHSRLLGLGRAATEMPESDISGAWQTPEVTIELYRTTANRYTAKGIYERQAPAGLGFGLVRARTERVEVTYELVRFGNVLEGTVTRSIDGDEAKSLSGLLFMGPLVRQVVLRLASDGSSISVLREGAEDSETVWKRAILHLEKQ